MNDRAQTRIIKRAFRIQSGIKIKSNIGLDHAKSRRRATLLALKKSQEALPRFLAHRSSA